VILPHLNVTDGISVGKNLEATGTLLLGQAAPAGGLQVTLTSHSANLLLSLSPTTAGSSSIVIPVPAGASSANYYIQSASDSGSGTYTAAATGYQDGNGTIAFAPSGVVIQGPFGFGFPLVTTVAGGQQPVTVSTALLDSSNNFVDFQALAGGQTLSVTLANSNPSVGTVPSPVAIASGTNGTTVQFTPLSVGQTTISVVKPANFAQPTANTTLTARVNP